TPFPEEQQKQEESEVEAARRAHEDSDALGRTKSEQETKPLLAAEEHVKRYGTELHEREIRHCGLVHAEVHRDEPVEAVGQQEGGGGGRQCASSPLAQPERALDEASQREPKRRGSKEE